MQKIFIALVSCGEDYDPVQTQAVAKVAFSDFKVRGQIAKSGRYKGLPLPYGSSDLEFPERARALSEESVPCFESVRSVVNAAKNASHYIDIIVEFDNQPNCDKSSEFALALGSVGVPIHLSFYKGEDSASSEDEE